MRYNKRGHNLIEKESKRDILCQFPFGDCVQQSVPLCIKKECVL